MKNLIPYPDCSKRVYHTAVARKEDEALRNRLTLIEHNIGDQYDIYDSHFVAGTLTALNPNAEFIPHKADIHSLYDYNSKTVRDLKKVIEDHQPAPIRYTCQNCTLTSNESFDHYLPKEEFPEYSIHTKNLIPSCRTCNGHKSNVWKNGDEPLFINHYTDILPDVQYLFLEVIEEPNNEINFRFYLDNLGNIPDHIFRKIESHYSRLKLPERMRMRAVSVVSELENSISANIERVDLLQAVDTVISTAQKNQVVYGTNYWKSILEITLVQNGIFIKRFYTPR